MLNRGPIRVQDDFLTLMRISIPWSSLSHADNNDWSTEGASNSIIICIQQYAHTNLRATLWYRGTCYMELCPSVCMFVCLLQSAIVPNSLNMIVQTAPHNSAGTLRLWHQRSWCLLTRTSNTGGGRLRLTVFDQWWCQIASSQAGRHLTHCLSLWVPGRSVVI